jgi:hypothetical protein
MYSTKYSKGEGIIIRSRKDAVNDYYNKCNAGIEITTSSIKPFDRRTKALMAGDSAGKKMSLTRGVKDDNVKPTLQLGA